MIPGSQDSEKSPFTTHSWLVQNGSHYARSHIYIYSVDIDMYSIYYILHIIFICRHIYIHIMYIASISLLHPHFFLTIFEHLPRGSKEAIDTRKDHIIV